MADSNTVINLSFFCSHDTPSVCYYNQSFGHPLDYKYWEGRKQALLIVGLSTGPCYIPCT